VLTNLLVNTVEVVRRGKYVPRERWVGYAKMTYGPIVSIVLVLAIVQGWFDIGGYETRVWSLPLLGFVFGYATRRAVLLLDRFVGVVMAAAETSVDQGPEAVAAKRREEATALFEAARPRTAAEFRESALRIARALATAEVAEREATE
jgi:hypothetical protein